MSELKPCDCNNPFHDCDERAGCRVLAKLGRAQPAQAVPVLTDDPLFVFAQEVIHGAYKPEELKDAAMRAIRHQSAVLAMRVPMTNEQITHAMRGSDPRTLTGNLFFDGIRTAERHHGIVGKEGA